MLSFIYEEVATKSKNIEDFGAPLSPNLDRILQSVLIQMRTNLSEEDHPINVIVSRFQRIMIENIEQIRSKFRFT